MRICNAMGLCEKRLVPAVKPVVLWPSNSGTTNNSLEGTKWDCADQICKGECEREESTRMKIKRTVHDSVRVRRRASVRHSVTTVRISCMELWTKKRVWELYKHVNNNTQVQY